jgi:hypothetical protein
LGQSGVNLGSTLGQPWVNLGSTLVQPWVNLGSTLGQPGVNLGQPAPPYRGRHIERCLAAHVRLEAHRGLGPGRLLTTSSSRVLNQRVLSKMTFNDVASLMWQAQPWVPRRRVVENKHSYRYRSMTHIEVNAHAHTWCVHTQTRGGGGGDSTSVKGGVLNTPPAMSRRNTARWRSISLPSPPPITQGLTPVPVQLNVSIHEVLIGIT